MYQVRDTVSHGMDGVCKINSIIEKSINGTIRYFYELRPVFRKDAVLFLPVDNEKSHGNLRPILTRDQILAAIRALPFSEDLWIDANDLRKETFRRILRDGDPKTQLALVKTLYKHRDSLKSQGRKLHSADEACLKDAQKLIAEEYSYVLEMSPEKLDIFIREELDRLI